MGIFYSSNSQVWACSPVRLLDRPEGKVIKEIIFNDPGPIDLKVAEVDGDWLKVQSERDKFAWIRWRKDREMLVGYLAQPREFHKELNMRSA